MANSVDPDQTPLSGASDLDFHCLLRSVCTDTLYFIYFDVSKIAGLVANCADPDQTPQNDLGLYC